MTLRRILLSKAVALNFAVWSCLALAQPEPAPNVAQPPPDAASAQSAGAAQQQPAPPQAAPPLLQPAPPQPAPPLPQPAPPPTAADTERAKESFKAGAAAYAAGDYLAAIEALEAAHALTPLPAIAFSLAQAERRQYFVSREPHHLTRSVALFRRYLDEAPNGGRRSDAIDALAQLEPIAAKLETPVAPAAAPVPERRTRLIIFSETPGAHVAVDGVTRSGSPLLVDVAPGKHRVQMRAPGYHVTEREVVAVAGELIPVSVALVPLPSRLELSTPPEAEVYVDGFFASQGGERLTLELPSGTHRVSVVENGHRVATSVLELERGETQSHSVTLEPTAQRRASHALFIGGAAAAVAGTAFSVLAVRAQSSAEDFLVKQERENVSVGELVRYNGDVTRRNRYRWVAGASFGAGLGMLIAGLFLHELDEPEPEEIHGPLPSLVPSDGIARREAGPFSQVALTPFLAPGEASLTLSAEF